MVGGSRLSSRERTSLRAATFDLRARVRRAVPRCGHGPSACAEAYISRTRRTCSSSARAAWASLTSHRLSDIVVASRLRGALHASAPVARVDACCARGRHLRPAARAPRGRRPAHHRRPRTAPAASRRAHRHLRAHPPPLPARPFEPESFAPLAKLVRGAQFLIFTDLLTVDQQGKAVGAPASRRTASCVSSRGRGTRARFDGRKSNPNEEAWSMEHRGTTRCEP
jgi:hypothetical protein